MKKFLLSLVTDVDWDGDAAKVAGLIMMICGLVGFFLGKSQFEFLLITGGAMITSGKWSTQG